LGNTYSLVNVGDNLTLTFDVAFNSTAENYGGAPSDNSAGFRFGLYNAGTTPVNSDGSYQTGDDDGFAARMSTGDSSQPPTVALETQLGAGVNGSNLALSGNSAMTLASGNASGTVTNINGSVGGTSYYALQLSMTLAAMGQINFTVSEGVNTTTLNQIYSVSAPESAGASSFNEILIGDGNITQYFELDNVDLTLASVPEPSTMGIVIAGAGTLLLARRRRA